MKLSQILQSISAWNTLSAASLKPSLAYKILKYVQLVQAENDIVTKQRDKLIKELSNNGVLKQNSDEGRQFAEKYGEVLETESTLDKFDGTLQEVVDDLEAYGGTFTVRDLANLELFFAEK